MSGSTTAPYDLANKPTVALQNPLDVYAKAGQVATLQNNNKLFQAQQLAGQAFQNSIGPDGMPNQVALNQNLVAAGPGAALAAQDASQKGQTLDNSTLDTNLKRISGLNNAAIALTAQYPNGVPLDVANAEIDRVAPQYGMTPQQVAQAKAGLSSDPVSNSRVIIRNSISRLSTMDALHASRPGVITADDGQVVRGGNVAPLASDTPGVINVPGAPAVPGGQGFQKQTGPETNADLIEVVGPDGTKYKVPRSSLPGNTGVAPSPLGTGRPQPGSPLLNPNKPPPATTQQPATPADPATTPAVPNTAQPAATPQPATPVAPTAAQPTPPGAAPPGAVRTGLAPGTPEEMVGSAQHAIDARATANTYQSRIQPIEGAISALSGADTGKGGETLQAIRAYTQDIAPAFIQRMLPTSITDPKARAAYDEANKYLTGMAINAPGGARSDSGQAAAGAATPSVHISKEAAQLVAQAALAQQRLTQAGTLAFNKTGQPAANYDRFMNAWNTNADPRAFVADKMSAEQRADMVKNLGGVGSPAYQKFKQSYQDGVASGVMAQHVGQ